MKILLINGVNLNFLGKRNSDYYGDVAYVDLVSMLENKAKSLGIELIIYQSNHEGCIIDELQKYHEQVDGVIINPGAFTHYSYAIRDCLECFTCKKVEVHISNIYNREEFRTASVIANVCDAQICGCGILGYVYAMEYIMDSINGK